MLVRSTEIEHKLNEVYEVYPPLYNDIWADFFTQYEKYKRPSKFTLGGVHFINPVHEPFFLEKEELVAMEYLYVTGRGPYRTRDNTYIPIQLSLSEKLTNNVSSAEAIAFMANTANLLRDMLARYSVRLAAAVTKRHKCIH